jgi:hypothetical protein
MVAPSWRRPARPARCRGAGDGAGIPGEHAGLELPDVDAELEGARRDDGADAAVAQALFDGAAMLGQVAAAIAGDTLRIAPLLGDVLFQMARQALDVEAAVGKDNRRHFGLRERRRDPPRRLHVAAPDAPRAVDDGRVVDVEDAPAARGAALRDRRDRGLEQALGVLARVGDRRRTQDEDGPGPVKGRDALQPAQHVGDVAAEDPAIGMHLVDDDVAQPREKGLPAIMVGQDARVHHVRVGDDDATAPPDGAPRIGRCVAVIGVCGDGGARPRGEGVELGDLVVRERLRREEIQCPGLGRGEQRRQHGQVVDERLAAGRGRGDDDVLATQHRRDGIGLVCVECLDAPAAERLDDRRREPVRKRPETSGLRGLGVPRNERQAALGMRRPALEDLISGRHGPER